MRGGLAKPDHDDLLGALQLKDLISAVSLITSQYYRSSFQHRKRHIDTLGRWLKGAIRNPDVHGLLCKAIHVFRDWPNNYFSFLEWRRQSLGSAKHVAGIKKDFGHFELALRGLLKSNVFDFMREGFDEYITKKWTGGYASSIKRLRRRAYDNKRFVSKQEACKLLGVGTETANELVATGRLKGVITRQGRSRMMLIESISIEELKAERSDLIDKKQAAKRLGINTNQTETLVHANLLTERSSYDGRSSAFYSITEIDCLIARVISVAPQVGCAIQKETIDFGQALFKLASHRDIGVAEIIQSILEGKLHPSGMNGKPGLIGLNFYRRDLIEYQQDIYRTRYPNVLSTFEAAEVLRTTPRVIRFLIKKNLLSSQRIRYRLVISQTAIPAFLSKYILASTLASELGREIGYLIKILKMENINPLSISKSDRPQNLVYRKSDIDKIDLAAVVFARALRLGLHQAGKMLLNVADAARFLQTDQQTILQLVASEILRPRKCEGVSEHLHYFSGHYLRRFDGRVAKYIGLISMEVAGRLFKKNVSTLKKKYVASGQLKIIKVRGDRRLYFRRQSVEELIESEKRLMTPAEVRAFLGISHSQLFRMIKTCILKRTRGPSVDGSPTNLFLRSDIEKIYSVRKRFKVRRLAEGGSSRFGSPAGPKRTPVLNAIAPRIQELVEQAASKGKSLTGPPLHRQLLKEGYEVGINSVYVCLRTGGMSTRTDRRRSRRAI